MILWQVGLLVLGALVAGVMLGTILMAACAAGGRADDAAELYRLRKKVQRSENVNQTACSHADT